MPSLFLNYGMGSFVPLRNFRTSMSFKHSDVTPTPSKPPVPDEQFGIRKMTRVSDFHKRLLVFAKRFKTVKEIPDQIPVEMLEKARSRARIRLSNYLMLATALGCLGYAYSGRKAAERGESVVKMNREWHKEYTERLNAQDEAAAKARK